MTIDRISGGAGPWPAAGATGTTPAGARSTAPSVGAGDDGENASATVTLSAASLTFSGDEIPALSELLYEDHGGATPTPTAGDGAAEPDVLAQVVNRYAAFSAASPAEPGLDVDA